MPEACEKRTPTRAAGEGYSTGGTRHGLGPKTGAKCTPTHAAGEGEFGA